MCFKVIKDVEGKGKKTLVLSPTCKYYVVSSVYVMFSGSETYIFPADSKGNITSYIEVYGTRPSNHQGVLSDLKSGGLTESNFYGD